ncbi:F0F1 ATP synthase subunit epsilon [Breoghania sp.]|uniref:F0F1 ATP synthase subunit epsilon n=1 Tax=Breoghania sp. TaxID=2065378 RepID=UPI0029CA87B7|nr:F0F1 ATP synthase subunit epsilon [Breoghania sp.]
MAEPFQFELVSPERLLISEAVNEVVVPGSEGDFGVLKDHAPFMSTIRPGFIIVKHADGNVSKLYVVGGFADVNAKGLTVLAEAVTPISDINAEDVASKIRDAEEDYADATDPEKRQAAADRLTDLKNLQDALAAL